MPPKTYELILENGITSSEHSSTSSSGSNTPTPNKLQKKPPPLPRDLNIQNPIFPSSRSQTPNSRIRNPIFQKPSSEDPTSHFVCTFCWQPQYPPSKPKLVGSSRISCSTCWKEILDLSICWVCGEQIVRGDEVVSLGWCFWHKVCFGCLICGRALPAPVAFVDVEQGECDGGEGEGKGKGKRKRRERGVELEMIPLCVDCGAEMQGQSEEVVLERGLETVGKWDGGLSRSRLMRISEATEREREADGLSTRWVSGLVSPTDVYEETDRKKSKRSDDSAIEMVPLIGPRRESAASKGGLGETLEGNDDIYVSVLNPLDDPAFKPSKTKPLPKWMSLLTSNRESKSEVCPPGRHSHSMRLPSEVMGEPIVEFSARDTEPTPIAEGLYTSLVGTPYLSLPTDRQVLTKSRPSLLETKPPDRVPGPVSQVVEQSISEATLLPRPSSEQLRSLSTRPAPTFPILQNKNLSISTTRKNPFTRAGSTGSSLYFTPLASPLVAESSGTSTARPESRAETSSFPFFQNARRPITPAVDSSFAAGLPSQGLQPFKGTPLEPDTPTNQTNTAGPSVNLSRRGTPYVQSAEFLDRYQPLTPTIPKDKYAAKEVGSIIDKFEKRKYTAERRVGKWMERGVEEEKVEGAKDEGVKKGLRKELKSLFEGK